MTLYPSELSELTQENSPLLAEDLRVKYNTYQPARDVERWKHFRPVILGLVAASFGTQKSNLSSDFQIVARALLDFCLYCEEQFGATSENVVNFLEHSTIQSFNASKYANRSRSYYKRVKSYLSFVADALGEQLPNAGVEHIAPYAYADMCLIKSRWAQTQSTGYRTLNARRVLAVCLGAGIEGAEAMELTGAHVEVGDRFVRLTSPWDGRVVPVHPEFDAPLRESITADGFVLFPGNLSRSNHLSKSLRYMQIDGLPRVSVRRLVFTWQAFLLSQGVGAGEFTALTGSSHLQNFRRRTLRKIDPDFGTVAGAYQRPLAAFPSEFIAVPKLAIERANDVPDWLEDYFLDSEDPQRTLESVEISPSFLPDFEEQIDPYPLLRLAPDA